MLPKVDAEGGSKPCGGKKLSCEVYKAVNDTSHFKRRDTDETFNILKVPLDWNSIISFIYFNINNVNIAFFRLVALKLSLGTE